MCQLTDAQLMVFRQHMHDMPVKRLADLVSKYKIPLEVLSDLSLNKRNAVYQALDFFSLVDISHESFYKRVIQRYDNPRRIYDYFLDLFRENQFMIFIAICNLYAYSIKENIEHLKDGINSLFPVVDLKNLFGRYAHKPYELNNALLDYTTNCIPELYPTALLLEYINDIYPCMPDMDWWRREGELQTAKSVYVSIREYLNKYPYSVFGSKIYGMADTVLPTLYDWLYTDIIEHPDTYTATVIRELIYPNSEYSKGHCYHVDFKPINFFLYFQLDVNLRDLVNKGIITKQMANDILFTKNADIKKKDIDGTANRSNDSVITDSGLCYRLKLMIEKFLKYLSRNK